MSKKKSSNAAKESSKKSQSNSEEEVAPKNIVVAGLIILLLVAGIGFLIFGLAQSVSDNNNDSDNASEIVEEDSDNGSDEASGSIEEGNSDDDIDPINDDNSDENSDSDDSTNSDEVSDDDKASAAAAGERTSKYQSTSTTYSRGNDYEFGDITGTHYIVIRGDTLWQIAEGHYGSGYAWVDINEANGGFANLPDGTPVNIPVGYNLLLPELAE